MNLNNRTETAWNNAVNCFCLTKDCNPKTHKRCGICGDTMIKTAHESNQPNAFNAWNIDHITPKAAGGRNIQTNLHAVHVRCNQNKAAN